MTQRDRRLLVLDDDVTVARTIGFVAEGLGFAVTCVDTPRAFFDAVQSLAPSHIAIDLIMPGMDGVEVMRRLAQVDCDARVIVTSGMGLKVLEAAQSTASERGLDIVGVLPKPFRPAMLRELLTLERGGAARPRPPVEAAPAGDAIPPDTLRRAIEQRLISIVAQPKVQLDTGRVVGAEILARWHDPQLGHVRPDVFVAAAEAAGLMHALTMVVLEQALDWFARSRLRAAGGSIAVNLSTSCLGDVLLADRIHDRCRAEGLAPGSLILEITESTAMDRTADAFDTLTRLRLKGFRLSLDDFGTGYSSLAQLARLPLSEIKIDRSFVARLGSSDDARKIVVATLQLARSMGLVSVAEGVEDAGTLRQLREMGCALAQGYLVSRPLPLPEFDAWLQGQDQHALMLEVPGGDATSQESQAALRAERDALLARVQALDAALADGEDTADARLGLHAGWQAILDALPAHVALLDAKGRIRAVNRAWREFAAANLLAGEDDAVGEDYLLVCDAAAGGCAEDARRAAAGIRTVLAGNTPAFTMEYPCHSPDEQRWFQLLVSPVHPTEPRGCVVMHVNVSDRRLAEESLRVNEARMRALLDAEPECVKVVSADGRLLSMNPAGLQMVQAEDFAQVAGRPMRDLIHPEDYPAFGDLHAQVLQGENGRLQFRLVGLQGRELWMETHSTPLRNEDGSIHGVLSITRDVTDRRALEARLSASQRLEAVGQLTGGLAHDFNNLLTVVLGNAELLQERLPEASQERALSDMIMAAARRGTSLTQRLLAFARRQPLDARPLPLGELVLGMQHLVRKAVGEHIALVVDAGSGHWVQADQAQLENALLNLCINARDAMPGHGTLTIRLADVHLAPTDIDPLSRSIPGQYVQLEVSDTGVGIAADQLSQVVEPFFTTKEPGKGTGLGLSMVYGLVKQSHGFLDVRSEPGRGTSVLIHLPRIAPPDPAGGLVTAAGDGAGLEGGSEHLLLVEDDAMVRAYAAAQLRALGYRVTEAEGGPQGLQALRVDATIRLLVTDVVMPGMSGVALAREARALRPALPVLFMSGYADDALSDAGGLPEDMLLLPKPYSRRALARCVRQAMA